MANTRSQTDGNTPLLRRTRFFPLWQRTLRIQIQDYRQKSALVISRQHPYKETIFLTKRKDREGVQRDQEKEEARLIRWCLSTVAGNALEVGCGNGLLTADLAQIADNLVAVDPSVWS